MGVPIEVVITIVPLNKTYDGTTAIAGVQVEYSYTGTIINAAINMLNNYKQRLIADINQYYQFTSPDIGEQGLVAAIDSQFLGGYNHTTNNYTFRYVTGRAFITAISAEKPAYTKSLTTNTTSGVETARIGSISMRHSKAQGTFRPASFQDWIRHLK